MTINRVRPTALATALTDLLAVAQSLRFWTTGKHTVKKFTLVMAAIVLAAPNLSVAEGALAIDENQGDQWGWAVNFSTQAEADQHALNECGYGCSIVVRFWNSCAAYAADQTRGSTVAGWSYGYSSISEAQYTAMSQCRSRGGTNCLLRVWGCDGG